MFQTSSAPNMPRPPPVAHIDYQVQRALRTDLNTAMRTLRGTVGSMSLNLHREAVKPTPERNQLKAKAMTLSSHENLLQTPQKDTSYYVSTPTHLSDSALRAFVQQHDPLRLTNTSSDPSPIGVRSPAPLNRTVTANLLVNGQPQYAALTDENSPAPTRPAHYKGGKPDWNATTRIGQLSNPLAVANLNTLIGATTQQPYNDKIGTNQQSSVVASMEKRPDHQPIARDHFPPKPVHDHNAPKEPIPLGSKSIPDSLLGAPVQRHVTAWVADQYRAGPHPPKNILKHGHVETGTHLPPTCPPSPTVPDNVGGVWSANTPPQEHNPISLGETHRYPTPLEPSSQKSSIGPSPPHHFEPPNEAETIHHLAALIYTLTAENESLQAEANLFRERTRQLQRIDHNSGGSLHPLVAEIYDRHTLTHATVALQDTMDEITKMEQLNATLRSIIHEAPLAFSAPTENDRLGQL